MRRQTKCELYNAHTEDEANHVACRRSAAGWTESPMIDRTRRRTLHRLGGLIALSFGSIAALLAQHGTAYTHAVFIVWGVLFMAALMVFRPKP